MKTGKRILCLLLAVSCLVLAAAPVMAAGSGSYSPWFDAEYREMQALGLIPKEFAGLDLTQTITRGEMCLLAVHAAELITGNVIEPARTDYFSDTSDLTILKAYEHGIVNGYLDGTFKPDNNITREEFFKIISNFCLASTLSMQADDFSLSNFRDAAKVGAWAQDCTKCCVKYGYVNGSPKEDGLYLMPGGTASRQEAMAMFLRCYKALREYYDGKVTAVVVVDETCYVTADSLNVRNECSTVSNKSIIGKLQKGDSVKVIARINDDWTCIKYGSGQAFVSGKYLSKEKPQTPAAPDPDDPTEPTPTPDGSSKAVEIANFVLSYRGYSYVWGGTSPTQGFDCSGLMYYCLRQYGYSMNRVADDQMDQGYPVAKDELAVGDLVFFGYGDYADHVGMYIGDGNFVHAANPSAGVRVNSLDETYYKNKYIGARRIITD